MITDPPPRLSLFVIGLAYGLGGLGAGILGAAVLNDLAGVPMPAERLARWALGLFAVAFLYPIFRLARADVGARLAAYGADKAEAQARARNSEPVPEDTSAVDLEAERYRAAWGAFLTRVHSHDISLPAHERDDQRIWPWSDLGLGAGRWVKITDALRSAGFVVKGNEGTWLIAYTVEELRQAVWDRTAVLPPCPAVLEGEGG
jgi:hypothetical protein